MFVTAVARKLVEHEAQRRKRQVDLVGVMLVDEGDADATRVCDGPLGGLEVSEHQPDQRRLAVAVLAEQHDARFGVDAHLGASEEEGQVGRVPEPYILDLHYEAAELASRLERERDLGVLLERGSLDLEVLELFLELLRLLLLHLVQLHCLGRAADHAGVEVAQILDLALLGRLRAPVRELLLLAPLRPRRVVALALRELARSARDVQRVGGDLVEEATVVRDDGDDALLPRLVRRELTREPEHRSDRQVVRRLVEQQQVRLGEDGGGERGAHTPSARKCVHRPGAQLGREPEVDEQRRRALLGCLRLNVLKHLLQLDETARLGIVRRVPPAKCGLLLESRTRCGEHLHARQVISGNQRACSSSSMRRSMSA